MERAAAAGRAAGLHNQVAVGGYRTLLVAREAMRNQFAALVDGEEDAARRGVPAAICIKVRCRNAAITCQEHSLTPTAASGASSEPR